MSKQTKTDKIRNMLADGVTAAVIAKKLKVSKSYVYAVKSRTAKKAKRKVTLREVAAAAHDAGAEVSVSLVPNNPLTVQVGGNHYRHMAIQPIQYIVANDLNFLEGCIVKRISRWREKENGVEDLEKIKHEVDLLIAAEQGGF